MTAYNRIKTVLTLAVAVMSVGAMAGSASASLLVYEPFAYADGWLTGQGGALGTTGAWTAYQTSLNIDPDGDGPLEPVANVTDWRIHQEGDASGVVVDPGLPVERNMFDGTVANLTTTGGYVGLPGPEDLGLPPDADVEIGRYMDASIAMDPSVTATFQSGTTTWFRFVTVQAWDRNMEVAQLQLATDPSPNESRNTLYNLTNSGSGIGAGGGPPRNDRFSIMPRYHLGGDNYNLMGTATGWTDDAKTAPDDAKLSWVSSDADGFGAANIVVGKIEWDADTGGEDVISVVRFLETDTLSEAAFDAMIAAQPNLSSANWASNKPDLDQSRFDTLNISGCKFFVDEIRIATGFADVMGDVTDLTAELVAALNALKDHITGVAPLSAGEIAAHKATIDFNRNHMGENSTVIAASFELVAAYENTPGYGPLWIARGQFDRDTVTDDIHWTIYWVMQYIMDYTYTLENISSHESLIDGFKFECSANFPGEADPPADPEATYTVSIDGTYLDMWGHDVMHEERPARKPTGAYLSPGSIATITVPSSIAGNGYQVRVGAQSWDLAGKRWVRRLDRSSLLFDINSTQLKVANPLGGGIYIEVPEYSDAGIVSVQIKNTIRSPYFSAKSFHSTTLAEWQNTERHHPGPWADFQSEKFMMQAPTDWIYNLEDPVTLMQDWDKATDAMNDLMGFPSRTRETMYIQVDVIMRGDAYYPGYPTGNMTYNPNTDYHGLADNHFTKGPQYAPSYVFHEEGHGYLFVKFGGETESTVNLLHVPVWHRKFGFDLDYAFAGSCGYQGNPNRTLDNTAVTWMTCFNFVEKNPMEEAEKAYQLKGHAKFVDMARLFGWEGLGAFWYSINVDYENGIYWSRHGSNYDDLIFRWCQSLGVDLRPLFHFWGIHPVNANSLKNRVENENLAPSAKIYDLLIKYKSLVPANNAEFRDFAFGWWGKQPSIDGGQTESEHARYWDNSTGQMYTEDTAAALEGVIDDLIALYFPGGRPSADAGIDMITWSGQAVQLDPNVVSGLTYAWSADPSEDVVFNPNANVKAPTVTITKPSAGDPVIVTLTLTVKGGLNPLEGDTMTIDVYDNACLAAIGKGLAADNPTDFDENCITGFGDLAVMAAKWLNDNALTEPIPK